MREVLFEKDKLGRLRPTDARSAEIWDELPKGKTLRARIQQPRNPQHNRKFFALLQAIMPHQELYLSTDDLLDGIKLALGHVKESRNAETLEAVYTPASINFGAMDQEAFETFYQKAVDLICRRIIPGLNDADLEREVDEILAGRGAR